MFSRNVTRSLRCFVYVNMRWPGARHRRPGRFALLGDAITTTPRSTLGERMGQRMTTRSGCRTRHRLRERTAAGAAHTGVDDRGE